MRLAWVLAAGVLLATATSASADELRDGGALPLYHAKDTSAPEVTAENLLASERFWPYRASLSKRDLASGLPTGSAGVLIRVEEGGRARIDFGRDGVHTVPVSITDLVSESNRVRRGELEKLSPNLALAIGPRLSGSALGQARIPFPNALSYRGFLAVFADPKAAEFPAIAQALAPFQDRPGLMTVLLPQTLVNEETFGARLQQLGWRIPYVYDYLAPGYTEALLADGLAPPALSLHTAEGRVLFQAVWKPESLPTLKAAVDRSFPSAEVLLTRSQAPAKP